MIDTADKILDTVLIFTPTSYSDKENIWEDVHAKFPPLGLASIAAYIRSKGHTVEIIDCNIDGPSFSDFVLYFTRHFLVVYSHINVIGISSLTSNINTAYKIAQLCKEHYPDAIIVLGGPHATALPQEVIQNEYVDIVVVGEGEYTFEEIVSGCNLSSIHGIVYKNENGNIITNTPRKRINDLDSLPMPAYDRLRIADYRPAKGSYKRLPAMSMVTSRGCPGACTFCVKTLGNRITYRSAEKIIEEIRLLIGQYKIKHILFYDDTFTVNERNVMRLCDLLIINKINITWTCFTCTVFVSYELLQKMKDAGCHQIMYGIESTDRTVLQNINKKIDITHVRNAVQWTKQVGIECRLAFLVGSPGDTETTIQENIKFINQLDPDYLIVNVTTPFPGTQMFEWAKDEDLITSYNWDDYTLAKPVIRLKNLNEKQIIKLYKMMYRRFYLRPNYIIKRLASIRSLSDFNILFNGFKSLLSFFY